MIRNSFKKVIFRKGNLKRTRFILIGLVLFAILFAGCKPKASGTASAPAEKVKLTFLCQVNVDTEGKDINDNEYIDFIRNQNNLDITLISESANYNQKVMTVMASGDLPDYIQVSKAQMFQFADAGLIIPLDNFLDATKYPHLMKGVSQQLWDYSKVNGKVMGVPFGRYDQTPYCIWTWKSWLDNVGMKPEDLKTVDDYTELFRRYTEGDPNRSGKKDTYALYGCNAATNERYLGLPIQDAFGAGSHQVINGEVIPRFITEGYKAYLKQLAMYYRNGYIVPDYITRTQNDAESEHFAGKTGIYNAFWSLSGRANYRDQMVQLPPPQKVDGSGPSKLIYESPIRHYIVISTACKTPERIIQMYDWSETDTGSVFVHAGVEGLDWTMNNGKLEMLPNRAGINWAWRFITLGHQKSIVDDQLAPLLELSWGKDAIDQLKYTETTGTNDPIAQAAPVFQQLADYDLQSLTDQYFNQAVMNQVDVDATWDDYVSRFRSSGGNEWIRLYTDWYNKDYKK